MLRVLKILVIILLSSLATKSQFTGIYIKPNNSYGIIWNRGRFDSTFFYATYCGVPAGTAGLHSTNQHMSALYFDSCGHKLYVFDPSNATWSPAGSSGLQNAITADSTLIGVYNSDYANYINDIRMGPDTRLLITQKQNLTDSVRMGIGASRWYSNFYGSNGNSYYALYGNYLDFAAHDQDGNGAEFDINSDPPGNPGAIYYQYGTAKKGIQYADLDSTNWTDSTLPTLQYVRSRLAALPSSASNGLTKTGSDIQLGSNSYPGAALTNQRYIDAGIYGILINRSSASGSTIPLQVYDDGGAGAGPVAITSINNPALTASSTNQTAVTLNSTNGMGAQISSMNSLSALFITLPSSTNSVENVIQLQRNTQGGTAANGLGLAIDMQLQAADGTNRFSNSIVSKWTDATNKTSMLELKGVNNGTQSRKAALAGTGQWTWDGYPALSAETDTSAFKPVGINSSGVVGKMANWVGSGGSVTLNNIGSGYRWVATPGGNFKTSFAGYGILKDSTTNANGITDKADTSVLATKYDLTNTGNLIAGKIAPSNSTGVNGNYYWNQIKSQLYLKAAGSWGNPFGYLISDTLQPLDTLLYNGSLVKMKEVWDTAAMTFNFGSIARNKNLAGNALLAYKDDPVFVTGWNITTGGAPIDPYKASYLHHVESNYDTKTIAVPYFEDHVSILFKPGSVASTYATGERIHSINASQTNYDIYEFATMASMMYQWRASPGAGYTPYFGVSMNGFGGIKLMTIDSITNGNTFQKYDGVDVWQKQTLNGRTRYLTLRSGFTDTAQLYAAGGTFVLQRVSGNGITAIQSGYLTLTNAATPSTNSFTFSTGGDGLMQILANSGGKFVTGFSGSVYGLALNKSITRNAYVDISNADLGQYYNMYFTNNNTYLDSVINGVNFNIEKYRSGSASSSALASTYGYQFNLNDVSRMATVFNSLTASNGNYLADWVWSSKNSGGSSLTETMRLNSSGELQIGSSTDQGAHTLQNTGGFYQNGLITLKGVTAPPSSYDLLVHSKASDSGVFKIPSSTFITTAVTSINSQTGASQTLSGGTGISVSSSGDTHTFAINTTLQTFLSDANNSGTSETDLFSHTLAANTLTLNGQSVRFKIAGTLNDITATEQLKGYFAGTSIFDSGALTISATGDFSIEMEVTRTTSSTGRASVVFSADNATIASPVKYTALTGITWTGTNIFKLTGTAGGGTGGSNDITATIGKVIFVP